MECNFTTLLETAVDHYIEGNVNQARICAVFACQKIYETARSGKGNLRHLEDAHVEAHRILCACEGL